MYFDRSSHLKHWFLQQKSAKKKKKKNSLLICWTKTEIPVMLSLLFPHVTTLAAICILFILMTLHLWWNKFFFFTVKAIKKPVQVRLLLIACHRRRTPAGILLKTAPDCLGAAVNEDFCLKIHFLSFKVCLVQSDEKDCPLTS